MAIIIGGSPSTGSSLLRRILNRNAQVLCNGETALFTKEGLYLNWESAKSKLLSRSFAGLRSMGWHHLVGLTNLADYGLQSTDLHGLMEKSPDGFEPFTHEFFSKALMESGKSIWAEKTPANAFAFAYFLDQFPNGKVVHTVRHPLDTISSLINRGTSMFDAIALYLLNASAAMAVEEDSRYYVIKYEDLVSGNEKVIFKLCQFLNIEFSADMLEPEDSDGADQMEGWAFKETDRIQKGSVGRFNRLDESTRNEIIAHASIVKSKYSTYKSVFDVGRALRYNHLPDPLENRSLSSTLKKDIAKDKLIRTAKGAYFNMTNYPLYIE
ncbi:MAG: sulfotransferase [Saprospiraceae bacterium]|nr:sulfotransferase [Saprospiraceae bacterium]